MKKILIVALVLSGIILTGCQSKNKLSEILEKIDNSTNESELMADSDNLDDFKEIVNVGEVDNTLWDESKDNKLFRYMVDWGRSVGQEVNQYYPGNNVDYYGVSVPDEILPGGKFKVGLIDQPIDVQWSSDGKSEDKEYAVVAFYSNAKSASFLEKLNYLFVLKNGNPVVLKTGSTESADETMYFIEAEDSLNQAFAAIVKGKDPVLIEVDNTKTGSTFETENITDSTTVASEQVQYTAPMWNQNQSSQLFSFMMEWGKAMSQSYKEYSPGINVDLYSVKLPDAILPGGSYQSKFDGNTINLRWSSDGSHLPGEYAVVAMFSDADTQPHGAKHPYIFTIKDGVPRVLICEQTTFDDGFLYFKETRNADLNAGFKSIFNTGRYTYSAPVSKPASSSRSRLWNTDKDDKLYNFMMSWGKEMGQSYKQYYPGYNVDLYGLPLPDEAMYEYGTWRPVYNGNEIYFTWGDQGEDIASVYPIVACYSDADTQPYGQKHVYFFSIKNGTPIVFHTNQNQGNLNNYLYVNKTANEALHNGFYNIATGR